MQSISQVPLPLINTQGSLSSRVQGRYSRIGPRLMSMHVEQVSEFESTSQAINIPLPEFTFICQNG